MQSVVAPPAVPVGTIKSLGPFGPKYQVGPALHQRSDGDWAIEITLIETNEKAEYSLTHCFDDPEAS